MKGKKITKVIGAMTTRALKLVARKVLIWLCGDTLAEIFTLCGAAAHDRTAALLTLLLWFGLKAMAILFNHSRER